MFNSEVNKNYTLPKKLQASAFKKDLNQNVPQNIQLFGNNSYEENINVDDNSKYFIQVADNNTVTRDPLGGLNFSGKDQSDLRAATIGKDQGTQLQTFPEGGLNLTGDPLMLPPTPKQKDRGTQLSTYPGGGLNLSGEPVSQYEDLMNRKRTIEFPDDNALPDAQRTISFPEDQPARTISFPGNEDLTDNILSGSILLNRKYIVTFPEEAPVETKTVAPENLKQQATVPQNIKPKITPETPAQIDNKGAKISFAVPQTIIPKITVPANAAATTPATITVPKQDIKPIPNASAEIKSFYGQPMPVKNQRLFKLILNNEYNPQLKDYLLTCRVDDLTKKVSALNPDYITHFSKCCDKYGIKNEEAKLTLLAQMQQESNFNENAESRSKAFGFMQIMPGTATLMNKAYYKSSDPLISWDRKMDYKNPFDNIEMGVALMAENLRRYRKTEQPMFTALGAYNAGTMPTDAYLKGTPIQTKKGVLNAEGARTLYGIPPYDEPQLYYQIIPDTKDFMLKNPEKIQAIRDLLNSRECK